MKRFAAAWLLAFSCSAFAQQPLEHEVKAAFLFKFLSFVEWPQAAFAAPGAPLVIGVAGAEDTAAALEQMAAARGAQGRAVVVRRLRAGQPPVE